MTRKTPFDWVLRRCFPKRYIEEHALAVVSERTIEYIPSPPQFDFEIYETFRKYLQHEDNLVNQRMSWMLMIHGFLYAAYALTVQKKLEIGEKLNYQIQVGGHGKIKLHHYLRDAMFQTEFVLAFITLIGLVISAVALVSIRAARKSAVNIQTIFEGQFRVREAYGIPETIRTRNNVILPTVAGGGDKQNRKGGIFSAQTTSPVRFRRRPRTIYASAPVERCNAR